jgi:hypothetical protein
MDKERNRNKRRDRKISKKKFGLRVDDSARKLALIKVTKFGEKQDPYNGRSRPD